MGQNMKTTRIEYRDFASVAEAVAHYGAQGFETFDYGYKGPRIMRKADGFAIIEAAITHKGLLDVEASVVRLA